jgi:hypothetical protein
VRVLPRAVFRMLASEWHERLFGSTHGVFVCVLRIKLWDFAKLQQF